ncbi:MAG: chemotaxis-specific protein-glutamate methyltransferase CheB [Aphanothece sp. CMT-3BRIN-NPC111]|jgi:two-component system chemotaxis response regulator CheB|nr:chemotaxis-specific protein-glutamate methyltransferase CheB [Aphanothece sp. CMT-3BRIN-NPC111]
MSRPPIRVLLVEDSPIALAILKRMLSSSPEIEVVGTAGSGREALTLIPQVQPQVICTDLNMPQMNGLEFIVEVMTRFPRPVLVVSASVQKQDTENVFKLLQAGAVDVFPKPNAGLASDYERAKQELISKVKILSGVTVFTQHRKEPSAISGLGAGLKPQAKELSAQKLKTETYSRTSTTPAKILVIGASTGGPQALHNIISQLPSNFPVPVICIQHISEGFLQGLVDWLGVKSHLLVKIAPQGELPRPGTIYFAPERRHLELNSQGKFIYSATPPVSGHCPSVTVTFKSIANFYGRASAGVLLTGMGRDGADGMEAIARAGGLTIAQDETSCVVFGMPKEAIALGAAQYILPINDIAPMLLAKISGKN